MAGSPPTTTAPVAASDPVQEFIAEANAKISQLFADGVAIFKDVESEAMAALGIAAEDLPALLSVVNGLATVTAVLLPNSGITPFISDVASIVDTVDKYVVTADGVVADPSVAVSVLGAASAVQKANAATAQVVAAYPAVSHAVAAAHVAIATATKAAKK